LKTVSSIDSVPLYKPDLERLEDEDPSFAKVQEARRSIREYADRTITGRQLGEFLYRVGRVADYWAVEVATSGGVARVESAVRPYPTGGALYELELYVAINACDGLPTGFYYYDPQYHRLDRLGGTTSWAQKLLSDAAQTARIPPEKLQVLIIIAARFGRVSWKYSSVAYGLILKDVGVLYQTMYLAATAMGLAPCALGSGDSDAFALAANTDYYAETSVGEFLLGSKP
jgi:SagB-type dehydrogenase family enzyme